MILDYKTGVGENDIPLLRVLSTAAAFTPFGPNTTIRSMCKMGKRLTNDAAALRYGLPCAYQTVGCRYCRENCDEYCGEGVPECTTCYTCQGNDSGQVSAP